MAVTEQTPTATRNGRDPIRERRPAWLTDHAGTRGLRRITPLSRPPVTGRLGEVFHVAAERNPAQLLAFDRAPDIEPDGATLRNFSAWAALVDEAAGWLHAAGIRPWDRVAIVKRNHFDISALASACARIGAIPALMAATHSPEHIRILLERLEQPFLVADRDQIARTRLDDDEARDALTSRTIVVDGADGISGAVALDDLRGSAPPPADPRADDELMLISHTSGTTGPPKLVMHSATSIHAQAHIETERWPLVAISSKDRVAFCDPFFHTRVQTALMVVATTTPRLLMLSEPSPENVRGPIAEFVPTVMETLPNAYMTWERLAREPSRPFRDVRLFINSFDAIHTRTIRTFLTASQRRMPIWIQSWSQSENGAIAVRPYTRSAVRRIGDRPPPNQSLGWPQPFVGKLRAVDPETGEDVGRGKEGLIEVSLPGRCLGYVAEQERHRSKDNGKWWNTGDLGVISRAGSVRLLDREVDRIPGSSCIEIEDVLLDRLPETTEVIVLAAPGRLPTPVLSTRGDVDVDVETWDAVTADLPPLAEPIRVTWEEFPRTATLKVRRNDLRERLLDAEPVGRGEWT
jgi:acyl-coenzyme A synthetase/AMP-(fatty) acid ligase